MAVHFLLIVRHLNPVAELSVCCLSEGVWRQEALVLFHGIPLLTDLQSFWWPKYLHTCTDTRPQPAH